MSVSDEQVNTAGAAERERAERACPACGAEVRRERARFCATCGRRFDYDSYLPADAVRASYHHQRRRPVMTLSKTADETDGKFASAPAERRGMTRAAFSENRNGASATAMAFVTYALVPYLGILFCPGALLMGGIGLVRARRAPHLGGGRASLLGIALGLLILCLQIFLWWVLYKVPEWAQRGSF